MSAPDPAFIDEFSAAGDFQFVNITPPDLPSGDAETWSSASLGDYFYLGWSSLESDKKRDLRRIFRYGVFTGKWETVYQKTVNFGRAVRRLTPEHAVSFANDGEEMLIRFISPFGLEILRTTDGQQFTQLEPGTHPPEPFFQLQQHNLLDGKEYALASENGAATLFARPGQTAGRGSGWEALACPLAKPSVLCQFQDQLVVAGDDSSRGFDLQTRDTAGDWKPVISRGGYRFILNSEVFGAAIWHQNLHLACGRRMRGPGWLQEGFEIVRVYPDWSWDVVIGAPRITNAGLKIPLAGIGPGTDEFDPANFCFLVSSDTDLLLGTYSDVTGLQVWKPTAEDSWATVPGPSLTGSNKLRSSNTLQIGSSTFLALDLEDFSNRRTASIWVCAAT